jgi:uncharacterized protein YciI
MSPGTYRILVYSYVEDIVARRDPFRPGHLANIESAVKTGHVVIAGAVGAPPHSGHIVFGDVADDVIEAFVAADPYMQAGLITAWRIEPWTVVATADGRG